MSQPWTVPPIAIDTPQVNIQPAVVHSVSVTVGHIIYGDTNGRFFTKCLSPDCENPDCVMQIVMDS